MSLLVALALSLGLTLLFELPVAYLWGLRGRDLSAAALAQVLAKAAVVLLHALALSAALPGAAVTDSRAGQMHRAVDVLQGLTVDGPGGRIPGGAA